MKKLLTWLRPQYYSIVTPKNAGMERNKISKHAYINKQQKRATLALSLCADGSKLPRMFIFKGTQNGWIEKKRVPKLSTQL